MIKKILNKIKNTIDKPKNDSKIERKEEYNPTIAGFKWTKERQQLVMQLMDKVPEEQRTYH